MSKNLIEKQKRKARRTRSVRKNISGSALKPRVSVYRSNNHIYAQVIDDDSKKTIVAFSDLKLKKDKSKPAEIAMKVGEELGKRALAKKVETVVFDRSGYKYHGRVKSLADGMRKAGLKF